MAEPVLLVDAMSWGVRLTLNRPAKLNALSAELVGALAAAVDAAAADPDVRVIALAGAGRAFCAGYDLAEEAEGDPKSGVIVGDAGVMVVDATATPVMAEALLEQVRKVTDKPVTHVLLSHYHAVRVMGASGFGAQRSSQARIPMR